MGFQMKPCLLYIITQNKAVVKADVKGFYLNFSGLWFQKPVVLVRPIGKTGGWNHLLGAIRTRD